MCLSYAKNSVTTIIINVLLIFKCLQTVHSCAMHTTLSADVAMWLLIHFTLDWHVDDFVLTWKLHTPYSAAHLLCADCSLPFFPFFYCLHQILKQQSIDFYFTVIIISHMPRADLIRFMFNLQLCWMFSGGFHNKYFGTIDVPLTQMCFPTVYFASVFVFGVAGI